MDLRKRRRTSGLSPGLLPLGLNAVWGGPRAGCKMGEMGLNPPLCPYFRLSTNRLRTGMAPRISSRTTLTGGGLRKIRFR